MIQTKTGFEILKVEEHFQAGLQPLDKVENEIMNQHLQPENAADHARVSRPIARTKLCDGEAGLTDTAAVPGASVIQEVAPTPDASDKKTKKKLPKPKSTASENPLHLDFRTARVSPRCFWSAKRKSALRPALEHPGWNWI